MTATRAGTRTRYTPSPPWSTPSVMTNSCSNTCLMFSLMFVTERGDKHSPRLCLLCLLWLLWLLWLTHPAAPPREHRLLHLPQRNDAIAIAVAARRKSQVVILSPCPPRRKGNLASMHLDIGLTHARGWAGAGFVLMTPQLFINYKLKSVAFLPWRKFIYVRPELPNRPQHTPTLRPHRFCSFSCSSCTLFLLLFMDLGQTPLSDRNVHH